MQSSFLPSEEIVTNLDYIQVLSHVKLLYIWSIENADKITDVRYVLHIGPGSIYVITNAF